MPDILAVVTTAILAGAWVAGLFAYFKYTNERQRENILLLVWLAMLVPVILAIASCAYRLVSP